MTHFLTFQELTTRLEKELYRLHYTDATVSQYRRIWGHIASFLRQEGLDHFTEDMGLRYLDQQFNFFEREKNGELTQYLVNLFRIIRMLGDFQQHGSILRRYYKHRELLQNSEFKSFSLNYQLHCQQKEYSRVTQNHYRKISERFLSFLESHTVLRICDIRAAHLSDYINTLLGYSYKTVELHLCGLRSLLRFIHDTGLNLDHLITLIPSIKAKKQHRIPSVESEQC